MIQLRKTPVGLKDIAKEAGVTVGTVSRVLNNAPNYAEKTRREIQAIAKRLNYRPNSLAQGIRCGTTRTAGVMVPLNNSFHSRLVNGIQKTLLKSQHMMILAPSHIYSKGLQGNERQIIHGVIDRQVDGIILLPFSEEHERSYFEEIWQHGIPLILVDRQMRMLNADFVGTDDVAGGIQAAEYLIERGHRNLLFIGSESMVSTSKLREEGFRKVLSETGETVCRSIYLSEEHDVNDEKLLQAAISSQNPDGVFCYKDSFAERAYIAIQQLGKRIPEDISMIGFGNLLCSRVLNPDLTTFDQKPEEIGRKAAELYLDRISQEKKDEKIREIRIPPELIVRGSCK